MFFPCARQTPRHGDMGDGAVSKPERAPPGIIGDGLTPRATTRAVGILRPRARSSQGGTETFAHRHQSHTGPGRKGWPHRTRCKARSPRSRPRTFRAAPSGERRRRVCYGSRQGAEVPCSSTCGDHTPGQACHRGLDARPASTLKAGVAAARHYAGNHGVVNTRRRGQWTPRPIRLGVEDDRRRRHARPRSVGCPACSRFAGCRGPARNTRDATGARDGES